ncbi:MAG: hydrogenase maturation nickel metallochaperone HypA [Candidatus Thiodiazotropha sp. (ex. Lucinisca nassula)]|uniref:hydrogenase maturation nickel metallochaperone HypA/HybF n=1 Tax=Candidatus Thiodiazotropha sp. LNASS1 TaxID=3096260 RepID=UPI000D35D17D|nr:hydrogenase maturation nickel metallochaperone HypA [Candidatus Thiodiazotropha sp. (ex. Lucinisca nassula)]MBW9273719.1 hydrogenase maturation nickel metallochaperone HypA [Candidatus Thiodiazotropha sp. (ex. Lucinisca nassula)]PUB81895.1 MAG: hydrogenase nickel incorporation protein HypA [gamma proteobacterium symbiont of Ctena orbiculata]PUB90262.1 MAG: hydrogenase nickel incorporation protein HypA [gamma proteobacterium symbiont of Ctena orbiculata]
MHELSVCQAMLAQVEAIAKRENASQVIRIVIHIGPLSGVVPELLQQAFTIARAGSIAAEAELETALQLVRVRCQQCGAECDVSANRLICCECGDFRTQLISGDELLLASVELTREDND